MARKANDKFNGLTAVFETITPERAQEYLGLNQNFRKISHHRVAEWAEVMGSTPGWTVTGEPIIFDRNGRLVDGQHRLSACIEAHREFDTLVVRGVKPTAARDIDFGRKRTIGQWLHHLGYVDSNVLAAGTRLAYRYTELGARDYAGMSKGNGPSAYITVKHIRKNPGLQESAICTNGLSPLWSQSIATFIHHLGTELTDRDFADAFIEGVRSGANISPDDAIWAFRERLMRIRSKFERPGRFEGMVLAAKSWNSYARGEKVKKLGLGRPIAGVGLLIPDLIGRD